MINKIEEESLISSENNGFTDTGSVVFENSSESREQESVPNSVLQNNSNKINDNTISSSANSVQNQEKFFDDANKAAFSKEFPTADIEKLRNSRDFQALLTILTKNPTLSEIYACFNQICSSAEESSQNKLLQAIANAKTGVGALSSAHDKDVAFFTKEQVLKMTPEQIKSHYKEIRESQQHW